MAGKGGGGNGEAGSSAGSGGVTQPSSRSDKPTGCSCRIGADNQASSKSAWSALALLGLAWVIRRKRASA
jgi:MYXO-CTERM domain-containing protein